MYAIVIGQCTPALITSVKSATDYFTTPTIKDPKWLLQTVKKLSTGITDHTNEMKTAHDCIRKLFVIYQKPTETIDDYFDRFKEVWDTSVLAGGGNDILVPKTYVSSNVYGRMTTDKLKESTKAMYVFLHADRIFFGIKLNEI